jgi:hypothetical protein
MLEIPSDWLIILPHIWTAIHKKDTETDSLGTADAQDNHWFLPDDKTI